MVFVDDLVKEGWLKTPNIIEAFEKIKREDFVPEDINRLAELNEALPIGFGQTISQPLTVAFMLELLRPEPGDKILDVGAGSGWTTALLAYCVCQKSRKSLPAGRQGKVVAIEIVPELYEFGKKNIEKYGFVRRGIVEYVLGDGSKGFKKQSPYDKILVSASAEEEPEELKKQLKAGGKMVLPIKNSIWLFIKEDDKNFQKKEFPGFVFVPLV